MNNKTCINFFIPVITYYLKILIILGLEVRSESGQSGYPMSHPQKGGLRIDRIIRRIDRMVHRISDESDEINHRISDQSDEINHQISDESDEKVISPR